MLYTHIHADVSRNIITTSMNERTHFFRKNIPLTLYCRKGCERVNVGCVWEVSRRREQTANPSSSGHSSTSSSFCWAAQPGSWGPKPSVWSWFSHLHFIPNWNCNLNSNWLELTALNWLKPSVAPGYIIVWRTPASCGRTHLYRIQPRPQVKVLFRYLRPDAPVIYTGASINWRLGRGSICYM